MARQMFDGKNPHRRLPAMRRAGRLEPPRREMVRPFCSARCRLIDQGAWASGAYRVPAVDPPDDFDAPLPPDDA